MAMPEPERPPLSLSEPSPRLPLFPLPLETVGLSGPWCGMSSSVDIGSRSKALRDVASRLLCSGRRGEGLCFQEDVPNLGMAAPDRPVQPIDR